MTIGELANFSAHVMWWKKKEYNNFWGFFLLQLRNGFF